MGFDLTGTIICIIACGVSAIGYFAITKMLNKTDEGDGIL